MRHLSVIIAILAVWFISCSAEDNDSGPSPVNTIYKLKITAGKRELTASIYDNATSRDFIAQLPLTTDLDDYASAEKIFYPPRKLSVAERNTVSDPAIGDINVYAPWGNIAIFYKNYSGSRDLIRIARIESGMDALSPPGKINQVIFELVEIEQN